MTPDDIVSRLRAAEKGMTPGPWHVGRILSRTIHADNHGPSESGHLGLFEDENDAAGIVLLRNLGPGRIADLIEAAREYFVAQSGTAKQVAQANLRFALTAIEEAGK